MNHSDIYRRAELDSQDQGGLAHAAAYALRDRNVQLAGRLIGQLDFSEDRDRLAIELGRLAEAEDWEPNSPPINFQDSQQMRSSQRVGYRSPPVGISAKINNKTRRTRVCVGYGIETYRSYYFVTPPSVFFNYVTSKGNDISWLADEILDKHGGNSTSRDIFGFETTVFPRVGFLKRWAGTCVYSSPGLLISQPALAGFIIKAISYAYESWIGFIYHQNKKNSLSALSSYARIGVIPDDPALLHLENTTLSENPSANQRQFLEMFFSEERRDRIRWLLYGDLFVTGLMRKVEDES